MHSSLHLWLLPVLPLAGFLINGLLGRKMPRAFVTTIALLATAIPFAQTVWIWLQFHSLNLPYLEHWGTWIHAGSFSAGFDFRLDQLTMVMLFVVTGVGFLIHLYSVGYMAEDGGYWRFFSYMNFFMFSMLVLVLAENYLLMFIGWEGVGFASYLLIGYFYLKNTAADAGLKAFVVNRIGDFGFLIAFFMLIVHFHTLDFHTIFSTIAAHPERHGGFLTAIAIFLLAGAVGKSAQIPLYVWLPDAMEGPTPVSALIHAATMVTAGVYMIARSHAIFGRSDVALTVVAIVGAATAFIAATIGLAQRDIKRVLAYSTISQIGYMFLACGVASYATGIFHLVSHAFFKALLFLAAGSVIHALNGEQDMRFMGGLWKKQPITFLTMTSAVFAITGIPPFAGFFSKDAILYQAFISPNGGKIYWFVGLVAAFFTSLYMFRLWYMTFFKKSRYDQSEFSKESAHEGKHGHHGIHESPWVMLIPLIILGILSLIGGWIGIPATYGGHDAFGRFLAPLLGTGRGVGGSNHLELTLSAVTLIVVLIGWFIAHMLYYVKPELPSLCASRLRPFYVLIFNKYWVDELYAMVIVTPLLVGSRYVLKGLVDTGIIDGVTYGSAYTAQGFGALVSRIQSGNIRSYAGWLAVAGAILLIVAYFGFSAHFVLR